jgi:hypothetical protein
MDETKKSNWPNRRRWAAILLVLSLFGVIGSVALTGLALRGSRSARYEAVHYGMTIEEIFAVVNPGVPCPHEDTTEIPHLSVEILLLEDFPFPPSRLFLKLVNGRLVQKELRKPSLGEIFAYWFRKARAIW